MPRSPGPEIPGGSKGELDMLPLIRILKIYCACAALLGCGKFMASEKKPTLAAGKPLASPPPEAPDEVPESDDATIEPISEEETDPEISIPIPPPPVEDPAITDQEVFQLFADNVYPIVEENCGSCHGAAVQPFFASGDAEASYQAILESAKIDAENPDLSRIYLRVAEESHNCWNNCSEDAVELLEAIEVWAEGAKVMGEENEEVTLDTNSLALASGIVSEQETDPTNMVLLATSYTEITAPMVQLADDPEEEAPEYLVIPEGNGGRIGPADAGGQASYTFNVEEAGGVNTYLS